MPYMMTIAQLLLSILSLSTFVMLCHSASAIEIASPRGKESNHHEKRNRRYSRNITNSDSNSDGDVSVSSSSAGGGNKSAAMLDSSISEKLESANGKNSNNEDDIKSMENGTLSSHPKYHFDTHGRTPTMDSKVHYLVLDKRAEKSSSYRNCLAYFMEVAAMSER